MRITFAVWTVLYRPVPSYITVTLEGTRCVDTVGRAFVLPIVLTLVEICHFTKKNKKYVFFRQFVNIILELLISTHSRHVSQKCSLSNIADACYRLATHLRNAGQSRLMLLIEGIFFAKHECFIINSLEEELVNSTCVDAQSVKHEVGSFTEQCSFRPK